MKITKEEKIRQIAKAIYLKNKDNGFEDSPPRDWIEAEAIYSCRTKYLWWCISRGFSKYHYEIIALVAILSFTTTTSVSSCNLLKDQESAWL